MGSINKVILVGFLGADPELRFTPSNRPVCNLSVATNETWKDKGGAKQQRTEWHRVIVWGDQGENCEKFLKKGRMVYVEGRLQTRSWDDKDGKKRYATEVVAERVVFLGGHGEQQEQDEIIPSKRDEAPRAKGNTPAPKAKRGWGEPDVQPPALPAEPPHDAGDDDIPF